MTFRTPALSLAAVLLVFAPSALAQAPAPAGGGRFPRRRPRRRRRRPQPAVTRHQITIGGATIAYTATAATIDLKNDKQELIGRMFYVAYTEGDSGDRRPVTFIYNGGPGSSTMWLHMGSFGPVGVRRPTRSRPRRRPTRWRTTTTACSTRPTWCSSTRPAPATRASPARASRRTSTASTRTPMPSPSSSSAMSATTGAGTRRSSCSASATAPRARRCWSTRCRKGMAFNGVVLMSSFLNASRLQRRAVRRPALRAQPADVAAIAWYHDKLPNRSPPTSRRSCRGARIRLRRLRHALAQGSHLDAGRGERMSRSCTVHGHVQRSFGTRTCAIAPDRFEKELMRDQRRTVGRLDARFEGIDHDAAGESPECDAADAAVSTAFSPPSTNTSAAR